ncbi:MAG: bifunctional phosphoglucose/phosphomannose isomerase [Candidatus Paceibacterota bacterium]
MNNKLDKFNLRQVILEAVEQIHYQYQIENLPSLRNDKFNSIIINGMGGSALPAELLAETFSQYTEDGSIYPIYINRDYDKSRYINDTSLIFAISYSGNTEETLSAYESAISENRVVIAMAAGGALIERAKELNQPYVLIPNPTPDFQPRYATLYILKAIIEVLIKFGILSVYARDTIVNLVSQVKPESFESQGQALAELIKGRTPIIYATCEYKLVAHLWKIKINENAKTPCFWNYVPELNHNEMVGFTNPQAKFQFILLQNEGETSRNIKRFEKLKQLFESRGLNVHNIAVRDFGNKLANLVSMTLIGDWTAYYLALAYDIDPTPVDMVEEFKILMKD